VSLSGSGVAPLLNLSPTLSFGNIIVGQTSATKTATLTNNNTVGLTINSVGISGDFAIVADGCTGVLPANSSCTVTVNFSPTASGARTGALTVTSNAKNTPASINLQGNGTLLAPTFSPSSLQFGAVTVGMTSAPKTVTLTNPNVVGLPFTSASVNLADFVITSDTCSGNTIAASGTCAITVTFTPAFTGNRPGQLSVVDGGGSGTQKYAFSGTGK
jgi:hypothetical protein